MRFQCYYNASYSINYAKWVRAIVNEHLNKTNSVILIGIGLHDWLDFDNISKDYMDPILDLVDNKSWPKILWITTRAREPQASVTFRSSQGNDRILMFNWWMREYLKPRGVGSVQLTIGIT